MVKYPMRSRDFSEFTVGTLASLTGNQTATKIDTARLNGCSIRKTRYHIAWQGKTAGPTEGPVVYGIAVGLATADLAAFFAADPQSRMDDEPLMDSQRQVLVLGLIGQPQTSSATLTNMSMKNEKWPGWKIIEGEAINHFIFNLNPGNPMATGMTVQMYVEMYGDWLND